MSITRWMKLDMCIGVVLLFTLVFLCASLVAQQPDPAQAKQAMQEKVAAFKESLAQNQAALKTYKWTEATEISLKGEVKKREQKECHYGPDGKVQKTPIGEQPQQQQQSGGGRREKGGAVKKVIVKNKIEDTQEYMEKAAALIHEYVPPDPQKIQAAAAAGKVSTQPASQGVSALTIKDYLKPGDTLAIGLDSNAKQIRTFKVQSYVDDPKDDAVTLAVTFANLPDGTNYPQQTLLDVVAKKIKVKVTNSGYAKTAE
jgi:hypothetical protein